MAITIFTIYIRVVIDKVLVAGVVRGIYIDNINFALMGIGESGQSLKVISLYKDMVRQSR